MSDQKGIPAQHPAAYADREAIAHLLWQRFAPVHHIGWKDETHKAEYLLAADDILVLRTPAASDIPERFKHEVAAIANELGMDHQDLTTGKIAEFARKLRAERDQAISQVEDARARFVAIQKATVGGRVCDDIAWFDEITTLHDYCGEAADKLSHSSTDGAAK